MKWKKLGLIFNPDKKYYWMHSHAALPTYLYLHDDIYRIYFTSRDSKNIAYVGFFEFDITNPTKIIRVSENPVLSHGNLGFFDDHGVQATSIVKQGNDIYLYYLGWNPSLTKPLFYSSIGLAISTDGGYSFKKFSDAPIMGRSRYDPWMVSGGTVIKEGGLWRMWYLSGFKFEISGSDVKSYYNIKYAESSNGFDWDREGIVAVPLQSDETNISRLSIIKEKGKYRAWFPVKKIDSNYRLGYAESQNGIDWIRNDSKVGIDVSETGWDSEALDKVEVILHKGEKYMLYNGNNFGYDGIGMAIETNNNKK